MNNRNKPCKCGSGFKYKRCCLRVEWRARKTKELERKERLKKFLSRRRPKKTSLALTAVASILQPLPETSSPNHER